TTIGADRSLSFSLLSSCWGGVVCCPAAAAHKPATSASFARLRSTTIGEPLAEILSRLYAPYLWLDAASGGTRLALVCDSACGTRVTIHTTASPSSAVAAAGAPPSTP